MPIASVCKIQHVLALFLLYNRHPRNHELQTAMNKEASVAPGQLFTASSSEPDTLEETPGQFAAASNDPETLEDTIQQLLDVREQYHQRALSNIGIAQERQKNVL